MRGSVEGFDWVGREQRSRLGGRVQRRDECVVECTDGFFRRHGCQVVSGVSNRTRAWVTGEVQLQSLQSWRLQGRQLLREAFFAAGTSLPPDTT